MTKESTTAGEGRATKGAATSPAEPMAVPAEPTAVPLARNGSDPDDRSSGSSSPFPSLAIDFSGDTGGGATATMPIAIDMAPATATGGPPADVHGNGRYLGPDPYFDDLFCLAAERAYVSCERIVPLLEGPPQTLLLNRAMVHGVTQTPNGAHFTSCVPDYGRDEAFQKRYAAAAADPAEWKKFRAEYLETDEAGYQRAIQ